MKRGALNKYAVVLPELEIPDNIKCPYCASQFDDKDLLSKHIDDLHIGTSLFEGNISSGE